MTTTMTTTVRCRVCEDCYLVLYAEYTGRDYHPTVDDERWERMRREYGRALDVCDVPNCYDERYDESWQEPSFSWDSCETCGFDLGGDRYKVDVTYRTEARA